MAGNNDGSDNGRKRKGKEIATETSQQPNVPKPTVIPIVNQSSFQMQPLLDVLIRPQPEPINLRFPPAGAGEQNPNALLDQILSSHHEEFKNAIYATVDKLVEEMAGASIRRKDIEIHTKQTYLAKLKDKIEQYDGGIRQLHDSVEYWKHKASNLRKEIRVAAFNNALSSDDNEDAESSHVGRQRVAPVNLDCKVCRRNVATIMIWPCRHVCLCTSCNEVTLDCPVCKVKKVTVAELRFPDN